MAGSQLSTWHDGAPDGAPFLIFHDRYELLDDARALGERLGNDVLRIAVRGARTQTMGGSGVVKGFYWYIGPVARPELSTLGDGLYQLELLIDEIAARHPGHRIGVLGKGEGGVIALLAALIWPDRIGMVEILGAGLPENLADMPVETGRLDGVGVKLVDTDDARAAATAAQLRQRGARVETVLA
jgi:pimeloyl-ACP methyl ester carboxylesterase